MKIVHLCNLPLSPDHPDAARLTRPPGRWALNLAIAQAAHPNLQPECVVVTSGASRLHVAEFEGIRVHYVPVASRLRAATLFFREIRSVAEYVRELKPDVVHAHGSEDSNLLIALHTRVPYVFTAQALFFQMKERVCFPLICRQRITGFLEDWALRRTRLSIGKSEYVKKALETRYPQMRVELIPNTFDARLLDVPWPERKVNAITFVGNIDHRKGVDLIRDALAQMDAVDLPELWIIGNKAHPEDYEQALLGELMQLLGEKLKLFGQLSPPELVRRLAGCKALVAPSREEMFGNQLVEALLAGTHAIVTDETAMAENVRRFGNGTIVPQENSEELAEAIAVAVSRDEWPEQVSAKQNVVEYMGPPAVAERHYQYYLRIRQEV